VVARKAIPLLDSPSIKNADIARAASAHAGRPTVMEWKSDSISKFKDGVGPKRGRRNGISRGARRPTSVFHSAPTERAASEMLAVVRPRTGGTCGPHAAGAEALDVDRRVAQTKKSHEAL